MPSAHLQQQLIRLWQCCEGKSQETTFNELAALLSCSHRHMCTLFNTMQDRSWLTWEAEAGRGKRSCLASLYTGLMLQQQRAEDLPEQDRIDQLVQLVGDKTTVRQVLVSRLGRSFRQGRYTLCVFYYRPLHNLLLSSALHRSETHVIRRIFGSLTRINEEDRELEADIVHHWRQMSPLYRRFFLHLRVHFHHGHGLEMDDMVASLKQTNTLLLYPHIANIVLPAPWTLDIYLTQPDRWLSLLLGQAPAMTLSHEWGTLSNFVSHPIGTGPHAVIRNSANQLETQAFDDFSDCRALVDEVNAWALPEIAGEPAGGLMLRGPQDEEKEIGSRPGEGCYYLSFDSRTHRGANQ